MNATTLPDAVPAERIAGETLVTLVSLSREFRSSRTGNTVHIASVRRWVRRGIAGVRLGTIHVGGTVYTSREEFARWRAAVARERGRLRQAEVIRGGRTQRQHDRAQKRAQAVIEARKKCKQNPGR